MTHRWDCLCAGIIVADQVCEPIAAIPPAGGLALTPGLSFSIGGCAANVAVDLAKLGLRAGVSGYVGDDLFGRALREQLVDAGVDCTGVVARPDVSTSGTFVINVQGEDRRFIHAIGANAHYDASSITDEDLAQTKILYVGGYCLLEALTPAGVAALFARARRAGALTMLDVVVGSRVNCWDWVRPVLPETDYFLPNHDEAREIAGGDDVVAQARKLRDAGCRHVVITCGGAGAVSVGPEGAWRAAVYQVPTVDPTGTGDAFVAGYVLGLLQQQSPAACLTLGSAMGAYCVQGIGATTNIPNQAELERFVRRHELSVNRLAIPVP